MFFVSLLIWWTQKRQGTGGSRKSTLVNQVSQPIPFRDILGAERSGPQTHEFVTFVRGENIQSNSGPKIWSPHFCWFFWDHFWNLSQIFGCSLKLKRQLPTPAVFRLPLPTKYRKSKNAMCLGRDKAPSYKQSEFKKLKLLCFGFWCYGYWQSHGLHLSDDVNLSMSSQSLADSPIEVENMRIFGFILKTKPRNFELGPRICSFVGWILEIFREGKDRVHFELWFAAFCFCLLQAVYKQQYRCCAAISLEWAEIWHRYGWIAPEIFEVVVWSCFCRIGSMA